MNKLWICVGCLALLGVLGHAEEESLYDYYSDEIEKDNQNSNAEEGDQGKPSETLGSKVDVDDSDEIIYDGEFEEAMKILNNRTITKLNNEMNTESSKRDDIDDYQIEDNRSEVKEDKNDSGEFIKNINDLVIQPKYDRNDTFDEDIDDKTGELIYDQLSDDEKELLEDSKEYDEEMLKQEPPDDVPENVADDMDPWESAVVNEKTSVASNKDDKNDVRDDRPFNLDQSQESDAKGTPGIDRFFSDIENSDEKFLDDDLVEWDDDHKFNIEQIINETKRILEETNENFGEEDNLDGRLILLPTSTKDEEIHNNSEKKSDDSLDKIASISIEKYDVDKTTLEKTFSELDDIRSIWVNLTGDDTDANINKDLPGFDELETKLTDMELEDQEVKDDYVVSDDKDILNLLKDIPEEGFYDEDIDEEEENAVDEIEITLPSSEVLTPNLSPAKVNSNQSKLIQYVDDALNANEGIENESSTTHVVQEHQVELLDDSSINKVNIFGFNDWDENSATSEPDRITLSLDTPVIITSPNYPSPYPANAVLEWILEGEGLGIEFNVTDFALNSVAGDYVMIKPGRADGSGSDGLLLSHALNSERAFRFHNVDRMFIRFESKLGLNRFRGFSFSVKLINPLPEERVLEPEPQPIGYPDATITLNLGGVTLEGFMQVEEEFRVIVADMAAMYIEMNQVDPGMNTTLEVTQITSRALCFHNWPQFEQCAEVRFGVPLQYQDEDTEPRLSEDDLRDMWFTYSNQNPFALRLQRIGIKDFQIPNDNNVLMVWLVIAAGVVISMAMLAFALWRFSCFEDYTRMPSFSDTESVNEKKTLDLYPTPHQTLPPLYSDTEYKWGEAKYDDTTRVDMSGFQNRSYVRTEDYDFDSEEEVAVPARDRYTTDV